MELTAAGLLTLGGPMVGAPRDGFRLALISLSLLGCALACLAGLVKQGSGFAKEGIRKGVYSSRPSSEVLKYSAAKGTTQFMLSSDPVKEGITQFMLSST